MKGMWVSQSAVHLCERLKLWWEMALFRGEATSLQDNNDDDDPGVGTFTGWPFSPWTDCQQLWLIPMYRVTTVLTEAAKKFKKNPIDSHGINTSCQDGDSLNVWKKKKDCACLCFAGYTAMQWWNITTFTQVPKSKFEVFLLWLFLFMLLHDSLEGNLGLHYITYKRTIRDLPVHTNTL